MLRSYICCANARDAARNAIDRVCRDGSGVTAIEYGLIAGAIAVAIIASVIALGGNIVNLFTTAQSGLGSAASSTL